MDGVLLIDKPKGLTSARVVEKVKRNLKTKAGHTGTLDPIATGLLVILTGRATRFAWIFQSLDKGYLTDALLGITTDTYDVEGKIIERREVKVDCEEVRRTVEGFRGEILQTPPPFSAKKIGGKRAYRLARKGKEPELKPIKVNIKEIKLTNCSPPRFSFYCLVSSGTYIRSLVNDIGLKLGTGAVIENLRRTQVGVFRINDAVALEEFLSSENPFRYLIPIESALSFLPEVRVDTFTGDRVLKGMSVVLKGFSIEGNVRIYVDDKFVGVGLVRSGVLKPERLIPLDVRT